MAWPYAFLGLSDTEKTERRISLSWYGAFAQLSVLVPLLALQSYFLAAWLHARWSNPNAIDAPSSPRAKEARSNGEDGNGRMRFRRMRWWMGGSLVVGGDVVGSRGEVLGAVAWLLWLTYLCFAQTDYLHLTKRFGIVGASQLPFHYLLAIKTPYSPLQYLTRRSHESLNTLHQLLGRVITILFYAHAGLYMNFYVQANLVTSKLKEGYVICGILGIIAFTVVGTTALAPVRRASYRVFYVTHVALATALLPLLWFHVSHIRIYLFETAMVYALNVVLRSVSSKTVPASLRLLEGGKLVEVRIPVSSGPGRKALKDYQSGQHAYLSLHGHPASRTFRSNPFSFASIPAVDGELRFLARILDGNTATLAQSAKAGAKQDVTIEGPYGLATHAEKLLQYDRVLFVAGGIGGTFVTPLYRQLLSDLTPSAGSYRRQKVSFVWVTRTLEDVVWALPEEEREREGFVERLWVWVTGATGEDSQANGPAAIVGEGDQGIEMEERKGLLGNGEAHGHLAAGTSQLKTMAGRPNLSHVVEHTFCHGSHERCAVVVCGPQSLNGRLREEVARWVRMGREVWFWEESFAM